VNAKHRGARAEPPAAEGPHDLAGRGVPQARIGYRSRLAEDAEPVGIAADQGHRLRTRTVLTAPNPIGRARWRRSDQPVGGLLVRES